MIFTPQQVTNAKIARDYYISLNMNVYGTYGIIGSIFGESSADPTAAGDKVNGEAQAFGILQWHPDRMQEINKGCGIYIPTASYADQLKAAYWEMSEGWYKKVWPELLKCTNVPDAVTVVVRDFEQSANQLTDIAKRTAYAYFWKTYFGD